MTFLSAAEPERLARQIADPTGCWCASSAGRGYGSGRRPPTRVGPTKTGERRTVPLPHFLAEQLGAYLADRPHDPDDLVFTMPQGGPLRASKWGERYFRPAAASAGLPERLRVHDLRHTAAALAIRENASVKIVRAMLGHRSATQTLDRYGHLYPSDLDALADGSGARCRDGRRSVAPASSSYAKGQVNDLALWWRWGDSNSRPAASVQGFSERSLRLSFRPGLSGGDAPGS
jgi:Phage integrase family